MPVAAANRRFRPAAPRYNAGRDWKRQETPTPTTTSTTSTPPPSSSPPPPPPTSTPGSSTSTPAPTSTSTPITASSTTSTTTLSSTSLTSSSSLPSDTPRETTILVTTRPPSTLTRTSTSSTVTATQTSNNSNGGFFANTAAVAGTFSVVGIIGIVLLVAIATNVVRRRRAARFDRDVAEAAAQAAAVTAPFDDYDDYRGHGSSSGHGAYNQGYTTSGGYGGYGSKESYVMDDLGSQYLNPPGGPQVGGMAGFGAYGGAGAAYSGSQEDTRQLRYRGAPSVQSQTSGGGTEYGNAAMRYPPVPAAIGDYNTPYDAPRYQTPPPGAGVAVTPEKYDHGNFQHQYQPYTQGQGYPVQHGGVRPTSIGDDPYGGYSDTPLQQGGYTQQPQQQRGSPPGAIPNPFDRQPSPNNQRQPAGYAAVPQGAPAPARDPSPDPPLSTAFGIGSGSKDSLDDDDGERRVLKVANQ